jgi:hypothetical protein
MARLVEPFQPQQRREHKMMRSFASPRRGWPATNLTARPAVSGWSATALDQCEEPKAARDEARALD